MFRQVFIHVQEVPRVKVNVVRLRNPVYLCGRMCTTSESSESLYEVHNRSFVWILDLRTLIEFKI